MKYDSQIRMSAIHDYSYDDSDRLRLSMKYFFILGNQADLAKAEIEAVMRRLKISGQITAVESIFLFYETKVPLNAAALTSTLGGTIKIGELLGPLEELSAEALFPFVPPQENKITFGISNYNLLFDIQKVGLGLKRLIKEEGGSARFVTSQEYPLSSVIVQKELLGKGFELVIMKTGGQLHVGKTSAVQPFELYSRLDYGRPNRDAKSGMLPPKLAQIMINLAELPLNKTILDPFCGSGTVLQQAVFLGYQQVLGADSSERAITDTRANLTWLAEEFDAPFDFDLKQVDVQALPRMIDAHSIDAIVTEPYLGPALRGGETDSFLERTANELATLYRQTLRALTAILKPKGVIIIIVPELCSKYTSHTLPINELLPSDLTVAGHWQYARPEQKVIRHVYKMIKA